MKDYPDGYKIREAWSVNTNYPRWLSVNVCGHFLSTSHVCLHRQIRDYLLIACAGGSGVCEVAGQTHMVREGDLFVTVPGIWHSYHSDPAEGWDIWWVHFNGTLAAQLFQQAGFLRNAPIKRETGRRFEDTCALLRRLCAICASGSPTMEAEASACLYETLLRLAETKTIIADGQTDSGANALAERLLAAVEGEAGTVGEMAMQAGMSKFHFIREFRRCFQVTPWRYMVARKIGQAKELLVTTEEPVKKIALACGFRDANFFSYVFRRETGRSATEFRRAYAV